LQLRQVKIGSVFTESAADDADLGGSRLVLSASEFEKSLVELSNREWAL
jgi:hypothetical protein